ncbi:MAG: DNA repair protein RadC [Sphingomonadales bacterium]|nr:DNA repair protein RadC [Sphingomonadales bacterium]
MPSNQSKNPEISQNIKKLPAEQRPREKLIRHGRANLEDRELLAILLGNGTIHHSALDLAAQILQMCRHDLRILAQMHIQQLSQLSGIGQAKAIKIAAAMELGRRVLRPPAEDKPTIRGSSDLFECCKSMFLHKGHEVFAVALLNQAHRLLGVEQISEGGISFTAADPRIILKLALDYQASSLILMHNHPSGNLQPSDADRELTFKVESAAKLLDLKVLDHLIFAQHQYFSFADQGIMPSANGCSPRNFT